MPKKIETENPGYQEDPAAWNGAQGETKPNGSAGTAADGIEDLRKWLSGEESLQSWLGKGEEPGLPINGDMVIDESTDLKAETASLEEKVTQYEEEIARLRSEMSAVKGRAEGAPADKEISGKVKELSKENARLLKEIEKSREMQEALKSHLETAISQLPSDKAAIVRKELELKELEKQLAFKEVELDQREQAIKTSGSSIEAEETGLEERFRAEIMEKEQGFHLREQELMDKIDQLEQEIKQKAIDDKLLKNELKIAKMTGPEAEEEIQNKIKELQLKEKSIMMKDAEIDKLRTQLREREDELSKLKSVVSYKEEELLRREEDILYREKMHLEERRRFDDMKKQLSGVDEVELKKRLEDLKTEIQRKEEEIRAKERYLNGKMEELRRREQGIIEEEISAREQDRAFEVQQAKVKTGNPRLDDLLLGGVPFGSNILIHGPPFVGKEVMVNQFMAEGLKKGVPVIWIITDRTPEDIREEMRYVLSGYEEYEKLGLVKYVDMYSRSMGETTEDQYTVYIDEPTDHEKLMENVERIAKEFKEKHEYYRLAFRSISTLIAYSDPNTAFRFLSPFCGRRKRDRAVSFFTIEKGVHGQQEIQMLGSIMDGMVDFKVDQLITFFSVSGISDVQSRAYIRYTSSKRGLTIGSFSLDHIR